MKYCRLNCTKFFFTNRVIPIWNMLNPDIVNVDNVYCFKVAVKNLDVSALLRGRALVAGQSAQPLPTV